MILSLTTNMRFFFRQKYGFITSKSDIPSLKYIAHEHFIDCIHKKRHNIMKINQDTKLRFTIFEYLPFHKLKMHHTNQEFQEILDQYTITSYK